MSVHIRRVAMYVQCCSSLRCIFILVMLVAGINTAIMAGQMDPLVERISDSNGWINWERQVVKAKGVGVMPGDCESEAQAVLMARAAATADAYRNLASTLHGVRVSGETYVRNFITESDEIRIKVEGLVRGAQIVSERQLSDRTYEVIMQAPLVGEKGLIAELASKLLPEAKKSSAAEGGDFTGLIIDCRGLDVKPSMSPKVYDPDGLEVYGTLQVSPDYAIEVGIAAYPRTMEQALKSPRAGAHPLVVKAVGSGPKYKTDVVVSAADAQRIREADSRSGFLSQCKVCILIGQKGK